MSAIAGTVRCMVTISGTAGHAGTVPMGRRHDAAAAAAEIVLYVEQRCAQAPTLVGTVGQLAVPNGAINIIPGRCELTLDIRAADDATRDAAVRDVMRGDRADRGAARRRHREQGSAARPPRCAVRRGLQSLLSDAVTRAGVDPRHLPSGAGHDAMMFDGVTDIAMLFVRCGNGGISHSPLEIITAEDADVAARVLLDTVLRLGTGIMTSTKAISDFVDREFARETAFLAELVKVPSDNPPGDCAAHAQRARELLEQLGLTVEAHEVPRSTVEAAGMKSVTNLIVRHRFGDGPVIALNAHGDVVPPGLGWRFDPYGAVVEDGPHGPVMYGRGVAVSKSDFATYTWTLLALKAAGRAAATSSAERSSCTSPTTRRSAAIVGPKWLLDEKLDQARCRRSPPGFSYAIVTAHDGCLHLEVTVTGKQAHAAMPETGVDALEAATGILAALYAHRSGLARIRSATPGIVSPTLNVGLIKGGINTNVVPDQVVFRIDRRMIPEEDAAKVEAELRRADHGRGRAPCANQSRRASAAVGAGRCARSRAPTGSPL